MSKKWTELGNNSISNPIETKEDRRRKHKIAKQMIKNQKTLSYEELVKKADESFNREMARKASLLEAYNSKKLQSKALIKEAKKLSCAKNKSEA